MLTLTALLTASLMLVSSPSAQVSIELQPVVSAKITLSVNDDILLDTQNCSNSWHFDNNITIPCIDINFWQHIVDSIKLKELNINETCLSLPSGHHHDSAEISLYFADNDSMLLHVICYDLNSCTMIDYQGKEYEGVFTSAVGNRISTYMTELEIKAMTIYDEQRQNKDK